MRLSELSTAKYVNDNFAECYTNLGYQFDPKGNLVTLTDGQNGIIHTSGYDELDRLIRATGAGNDGYTQTYEYDAIGNILTKSDVGAYKYSYGDKPHAVRSARNVTLRYDQNGNMIRRSAFRGGRPRSYLQLR
jgi:YD repeat-containing protein